MTSLESDSVTASVQPGLLPANQASLIHVDNPRVGVVTWKIAEDGRGTILRLEELAGKAATVRISSQFFRTREAWRCSGLEDDEARLKTNDDGIEVEIRPFEVVTLRLITQPRLGERP